MGSRMPGETDGALPNGSSSTLHKNGAPAYSARYM
jgi:hypothetical protein